MSAQATLPYRLQGLASTWAPRRAFMAGKRTINYRYFRDQIFRTRGLLRRLKVETGDRFAVASSDDVAVAIFLGAALLEGITLVVLDPNASASEATVLLSKAQPKAIAADQAFIGRAEILTRKDGPAVIPVANPRIKTNFGLLIRRQILDQSKETFPTILKEEVPIGDIIAVPGETPAIILFTSGTMSQPKGVTLSQANLAAQLRTFGRHLGYTAGSRVINGLPLHHTDGICQGPLLAFFTGGTWIRPETVSMQTIGDMLDLVQREGATHLVAVPSFFAMMERLPELYDDVFSPGIFEFIESTAGYLDENLWRRIEARFSTKIVNCYGLTETVSEALYCGPSEDTRMIGTIGKPVDCDARIVDGENREVMPGEVGELILRGEHVMIGYFEDPPATKEILRDGWLWTGDLATQTEDGFFKIVGRKKNVIIRGGINVYPADITAVVENMPQISNAATIGLEDPLLGERIICCVVLAVGFDESAVTDIFEQCRRHLSPEKVPDKIVVMGELPYGPSGKVELPKLKEVAKQYLAIRNDRIVGRSLEESVFEIAGRIFNMSAQVLSIDSTENSTAGWNSLSILELIMAVERSFDIKIGARDIMNLRSLGDLLNVVRNKCNANTTEVRSCQEVARV